MTSPQRAKDSFWQSATGIITAIAGLLSAVVAVVALVYQLNDRTGPTPTPPTAAATGAPNSATAAPALPDGSGPFEVTLGSGGIDLDVIPPRAYTRFPNEVDIYGDGQINTFPADAAMARWAGAAAPSRAECIAALRSTPITHSALVAGNRFCVVTSHEGHYAYLEFIEKTSDGFKLRATIWPGA